MSLLSLTKILIGLRIADALRRLEQLVQEAVVTVPRALIAETINVIAVLCGRGSERRLVELARVTGLSRPDAGLGNHALVDEGYALRRAPGVYQLA